MTAAANPTRAMELLADRALQGLEPEERAELDALLASQPELDDDSFDLAAAAVDLAYTDVDEPLPAALRGRLLERASAFRADASSRRVLTFPTRRPATAPSRGRVTSWLGWAAAAACLIVAAASWWPSASEPTRAELLATADAIAVDWTATEDPAASGAGGDVVWDPRRQTGYMRFRGLPVNDPDVEQYQLWIFDAERDERYPVDGGVFDVTAGEVVVPIDVRLPVTRPTLFAVTIEKPGGVVVSSRERLVLVAEVG